MSLNFDEAKDLIRWNKRFLSAGGIWPFEPGFTFRFNALLIYCVIHLILGIVQLIVSFANVGLMTFVDTAAKSLFIWKMLVMRYSNLLQHVVTDLETDVEHNNYKDDREKTIYMHYITFGMKFITSYTWITIGTAISYYLRDFCICLYQDFVSKQLGNETSNFILLYSIHIFFTITDYRSYILIYLTQWPVVYAYIAQIMISCFMCSLVLHVCSRLAVLEFKIRNIKAAQPNERRLLKFEFREIVQTHLRILWASQAVGDIFDSILLAEVGIVTLSIAVGIYTALVSSDEADAVLFVSFILYAISLLTELCVYEWRALSLSCVCTIIALSILL